MNITEPFRFIVSLSLLGSFLALGLLVIKALFKRKLSANWHYYIWLVLILRLTLPYTPASPINVFSLLPQQSLSFQISQVFSPPLLNTPSQSSLPLPATIDNGPNLASDATTPVTTLPTTKLGLNWCTAAWIWLIGLLGILFYLFITNTILFFKFNKQSPCDTPEILDILAECCLILKVPRKVPILYDESLKSPALFGLFRPKIIISRKLLPLLSQEDLRFIFLHELSHLKRRDLPLNLLVTLVQVIYWFNPVIVFALQQMKQECEMACDATALTRIKPEDHKKYGQTIIDLLQLLSVPHWSPRTLGFANKFNARRIIMISSVKKTTLKWAVAALTLSLVVGCSSLSNPVAPNNNAQTNTPSNTQQTSDGTPASPNNETNSIIYQNPQYGFNFTLPANWKGYSIVNSQWEGLPVGGETPIETGPLLSIRDPQWTSANPHQDIPIMIFTLAQWNSLQQDVFHIGAAPIGPSELARNNSYVFALPARYNFSYLPGYKDVETILANKPLQVTTTTQQHPDSTESLIFNMMVLGEQGKVMFSDFSAKASTLEDVEKSWGKADKTEYVVSAKGRYATYSSHNVVFGINKGEQVFEIRSYDSRLKGVTLTKTKQVLGAPAYDVKSNGQEIIGYTAGAEFKVEMVFPLPTNANPNPVIDHYNVLYPHGTVNQMADDPGRQW